MHSVMKSDVMGQGRNRSQQTNRGHKPGNQR